MNLDSRSSQMPNQLQQRNKYNLTTETMFADCARAKREAYVNSYNKKYSGCTTEFIKNTIATAITKFGEDDDKVIYLVETLQTIIDSRCTECVKLHLTGDSLCQDCLNDYEENRLEGVEPNNHVTSTFTPNSTTNETNPPVIFLSFNQEAVLSEQLAASPIPSNEENKPIATNPKPEVSKCPFCGKGGDCTCWEMAGAMQEISKITKQELVAFALENAPEITACVHKRLNKDGVGVANLMYVECDNRINIAWAIFENLTAWELPQNYRQHFSIASNKRNNAGKPYKVYSIALHGKNDCECYDFVGSANKHNGWCKHVLVGLIIYYTALLYKRYHAVTTTQEKAAA